MDREINAAFRQFLRGVKCLPNLPLWANTAQCNAFKSKMRNGDDCGPEIIWVIDYLGASRVSSACKSTQALGSFQISLFAPSGCGTETLYEAADCLICAIEDASSIFSDGLQLSLTGTGNTLPTTAPLITGDPSGRVLLPITVPFRAFYCC